MGQLFTWIFAKLVAFGVAKFFFSAFFFLSVQYFVNGFFGINLLPSWFSSSSVTSQWSNVVASAQASFPYAQLFFYLLNYFLVPYSIATALNAQVTRFLIRRFFK